MSLNLTFLIQLFSVTRTSPNILPGALHRPRTTVSSHSYGPRLIAQQLLTWRQLVLRHTQLRSLQVCYYDRVYRIPILKTMSETTSTIVYVTTTTVTPATVTSIVVTGTRTVTTCTPTITNTITMTPIPKTICEITFTTLQTTLTCLPVVGLRKLRARQAGYYSPPNCGAITTTTIATSTTIVAVPATWTATDTCYATSIETYVATATAQTVYDDISSLITYTPLPVTYTRYNRVRRSTTTEFITFTLTEVVLPQGTSLTQC